MSNNKASAGNNQKLSNSIIASAKDFKLSKLPSSVLHQLKTDPKHLGFFCARHKIVGKLLKGRKSVLEVGCQDGFGTFLVSEYVEKIIAVDIESSHITEAKNIWEKLSDRITFWAGDILKSKLPNSGFDAAYMLDVFEHIDPAEADAFTKKIIEYLDEDRGILLVGMPTKESQIFASKLSRLGHINMFKINEAKVFFEKYFNFVIVLGMNDEMINLNFEPLNHYMIVIASGIKNVR